MGRPLLTAALSAVLLLSALAAGAPAAARHGCPKFSFEHNGVPWSARSIKARNVSCRSARRLIKSYAEPRNCQFGPRCKVGRYSCRTLSASGSDFTESCTLGRRLVRWHGSYVSS